MNVDNEYLALALLTAHRSSIRGYKTGAVIVKNDRVVGKGWSHVSQTRRQETPFSCHAELHAITRTGRRYLDGATIYVATFRPKSGNIVTAEPCEVCAKVLRKVGIRKVVHT